RDADALADELRQMRLLLQPHRQRHAEAAEPDGSIGQVRFEQPLELPQGLLVEDDVIEVALLQPRLVQAIANGERRKARIVLLPREPLFLRGGHDVAVDHQGGGAVVIEGGDAEDRGPPAPPSRIIRVSSPDAVLESASDPLALRWMWSWNISSPPVSCREAS